MLLLLVVVAVTLQTPVVAAMTLKVAVAVKVAAETVAAMVGLTEEAPWGTARVVEMEVVATAAAMVVAVMVGRWPVARNRRSQCRIHIGVLHRKVPRVSRGRRPGRRHCLCPPATRMC